MASKYALERAAQAWCTKETENTIMDVNLAEAFADILDEYIEALQWCGGSDDFQINGKARQGWNKIVTHLI